MFSHTPSLLIITPFLNSKTSTNHDKVRTLLADAEILLKEIVSLLENIFCGDNPENNVDCWSNNFLFFIIISSVIYHLSSIGRVKKKLFLKMNYPRA